MARGLTHYGQLPSWLKRRLILTRFAQRLSHPLRDGHSLSFRDLTDLFDFIVFQKDLQSSSHADEYMLLICMSQFSCL